MRLLLIEDETRMAQALTEILRHEHYEVDCCADGTSGLDTALAGIYDIIILDVMLPGMNGFDVARGIRKAGLRTPILMLTARSELDDKVSGLDHGADDYLTKPFQTRELLARLRALTRRSTNADPVDDSLHYGDITLRDNSTLVCDTNGQSVRLGEKEYRILEYMMTNQGHILSREQLAIKIWGYESDSEYNNVEVYMSFTRKKLAYVGARTAIKAVRGLGYELRYEHV